MTRSVPTKPPAASKNERKEKNVGIRGGNVDKESSINSKSPLSAPLSTTNSLPNTGTPSQSLRNNYAIGTQMDSSPPTHAADHFPVRRRSSVYDQNLDVIEEGDNDSSTMVSNLSKSIISNETGMSHFSGGSSESKNFTTLDASFSSLKKIKPVGEHAKSMAKQLNMEVVETSSRGVPMKKSREYFLIPLLVSIFTFVC